MDRQELRQLYAQLAELEELEQRVSEWTKILDDPSTRFGFNDRRAAHADSRTISVFIQAKYPDHGPGRNKSKLVAEFRSEATIRTATKFFIEGLVARHDELRAALRQRGINTDSAPAGAQYDYEEIAGLRSTDA
jgi:hypothetical protein